MFIPIPVYYWKGNSSNLLQSQTSLGGKEAFDWLRNDNYLHTGFKKWSSPLYCASKSGYWVVVVLPNMRPLSLHLPSIVPLHLFFHPTSRSLSAILTACFYDLRRQIVELVKTRINSSWKVKIKILNSFSHEIWTLGRKNSKCQTLLFLLKWV